MKPYITHKMEPRAFLPAVHSALEGAVCRLAWIGYGNALYVGFELPGGSLHRITNSTSCRRELSTAYCEWIMLQGQSVGCSSEDARELVLGEIPKLISQTVLNLNIEPSTWALEICFTGGWVLRLTPWTVEDAGPDDVSTDAWVLQEGREYYSVSCGGELTLTYYRQDPGVEQSGGLTGGGVRSLESDAQIKLYRSAVTGDVVGVTECIASGVDVDNGNRSLVGTALMQAASHNRLAVAEKLIELGADVNGADSAGQTPLLLAVECSHPALVKILLENGATIPGTTNSGRTTMRASAEAVEYYRNRFDRAQKVEQMLRDSVAD